MTDHIVCLSFDHDNTSLFIANERTSPVMLSRGDFGSVALPRILSLLERDAIPATFFVPGHTVESYPADIEAILQVGHEIGHHGWTHRVPATLGREGEAEELARGLDTLRRVTGRRPAGYRSPAWDLSDHSVDLLLEHGFAYDSSLMGHDVDLYPVRRTAPAPLHAPYVPGEATSLIEMPVSWVLDDFPHFEFMPIRAGLLRGLAAPSQVLEIWQGEFDWMRANCARGVLTYTFHPFVIGRGHRMLFLERLIRGLRDAGATFLTMEAALARWRAWQ